MWNPTNEQPEFRSGEEFTQEWLNRFAQSLNSRFYAPIPFEYYEEMKLLSNEEFGKLIRALLWFCMTGEEPCVDGVLVHYIPRVLNRQRRFQSEWKSLSDKRSEAGKKGIQSRRRKEAEAQRLAEEKGCEAIERDE